MIVGTIAWIGIRDWRVLMLVCCIPGLLSPLLRLVIPESPRWLIAKGKMDELRKNVQKAAEINRAPFPDKAFAQTFQTTTYSTFKRGESGTWTSNLKPSDLFRPVKMFSRTICVFYNWMVKFRFDLMPNVTKYLMFR